MYSTLTVENTFCENRRDKVYTTIILVVTKKAGVRCITFCESVRSRSKVYSTLLTVENTFIL